MDVCLVTYRSKGSHDCVTYGASVLFVFASVHASVHIPVTEKAQLRQATTQTHSSISTHSSQRDTFAIFCGICKATYPQQLYNTEVNHDEILSNFLTITGAGGCQWSKRLQGTSDFTFLTKLKLD